MKSVLKLLRALCGAAAILCLAPAASAVDSTVPKALAQVMVPFGFCVDAKSIALDDGVSDAETIARAARGACEPIRSHLQTWFLTSPKLKADDRKFVTDVFEKEADGQGPTGSLVLQKILENRAHRLDRSDIDAVWTDFRPYLDCIEASYSAGDPKTQPDYPMTLILVLGKDGLCHDQFTAAKAFIIQRNIGFSNSKDIFAYADQVPLMAGSEAVLDRLAGREVQVP